MGLAFLWIRTIVAVAVLAGVEPSDTPRSSSGHPVGPPQVAFVGLGSSRAASFVQSSGGAAYVAGIPARKTGFEAVVTCTPRLENPHWSVKGQTVLFKTRVTCVGNLPTILVRVTTLMGRMTKNGMVLVAGTTDERSVPVTGLPSRPVYTPSRPARKIRVDGRYRGQATLEIIEPGGYKTPPVYTQTSIVPVDAH